MAEKGKRKLKQSENGTSEIGGTKIPKLYLRNLSPIERETLGGEEQTGSIKTAPGKSVSVAITPVNPVNMVKKIPPPREEQDFSEKLMADLAARELHQKEIEGKILNLNKILPISHSIDDVAVVEDTPPASPLKEKSAGVEKSAQQCSEDGTRWVSNPVRDPSLWAEATHKLRGIGDCRAELKRRQLSWFLPNISLSPPGFVV